MTRMLWDYCLGSRLGCSNHGSFRILLATQLLIRNPPLLTGPPHFLFPSPSLWEANGVLGGTLWNPIGPRESSWVPRTPWGASLVPWPAPEGPLDIQGISRGTHGNQGIHGTPKNGVPRDHQRSTFWWSSF